MIEEPGDIQRANFNCSVTSAIILGLVLVISRLSLGIFALTVPPVNVEFVGILFIGAALGMYVVVKRMTSHVKGKFLR